MSKIIYSVGVFADGKEYEHWVWAFSAGEALRGVKAKACRVFKHNTILWVKPFHA